LLPPATIALKPAVTRNIDRRAQGLRDKMAYLAVVRRIPVHGLVFEFIQSRHPAGAFVSWRSLTSFGP
jgi:hypothetical protein